MATIPYAKAEQTTRVTNTTTTYSAAATISSASLTAGNEYIVFCTALISVDLTTNGVLAKVVHGSTDFEGSLLDWSFVDTNDYYSYGFVVKWTAVASENLTFEYALENAGDNAYAAQVELIAFDVDGLTENTDYGFAERSTDDAIGGTWTTTGPSLTFTPASTADYWVVACGRNQHGSSSSSSGHNGTRINQSGGATDVAKRHLITANNNSNVQTSVSIASWVYTLTASTSYTFRADGGQPGTTFGSPNRLWGGIFWLRLGTFEVSGKIQDAGAHDTVTLAATSWNQTPTTGTITPVTASEFFVFSVWQYVHNSTGPSYFSRQQLANADFPSDQSAGTDAPFRRQPPINVSNDEIGTHHMGISASLSSGNAIDIDAYMSSSSGAIPTNCSTVFFSLELAGGADNSATEIPHTPISVPVMAPVQVVSY